MKNYFFSILNDKNYYRNWYFNDNLISTSILKPFCLELVLYIVTLLYIVSIHI